MLRDLWRHLTARTERQPMTHDYRRDRRHWGWDIAWEVLPGNRLKAYGWGVGLRAGDFVLLSNPDAEDDTTRYRIGDDFRYTDNVTDMWFATLHFAPRPLPSH